MIVVGTSGWQYRDWRGRFYPEGVPQRQWLEYYASAFATVEVNNAFYRLPERETFAQWRRRTPDDFCVAVKMSRFLTHIRRLRDPDEPVARFLARAEALGDRLGPVLLQLPPTLPVDPEALDAVLARFPATVRVAVEPRHESWWTPRVRSTLERHGAALAWADRLGRPVTPMWRTADWGYLRLHEGRGTPRPSYGRAALVSWLDRVAGTFAVDREAVHVYFNNDPGGAAIRNATALAALAARRGLPVSRYPAPARSAPRTA
ncbi:DUF72 domain-containing protein [Rugosimonospora acidiphila]|uniref:DUF72 domain-containing protein n=1 Tax=Rugosimonospora acidiphila TaxID=556531 RepID=A0ABP9RQV7_9ACTN